MKTALAIILLTFRVGLLAQDYRISAVPFADVTVRDEFWLPRLETNRTVSIKHAFRQCEETGRLRNFSQAASVLAGEADRASFCSRYPFDDSDVFKIIEGASYTLESHPDPELSSYLDSVIALVAEAQESDGYLYTMLTMHAENSWATDRWVNTRTKASHELYNAGHLYEAAAAHYQATGQTTLLDLARRNADLLVRTFGPDRRRTVPGHQVTELGLVKLYRVTGNREYLDLAEFFLDERGRGPGSGDTYNQDHLPVAEQTELVGHAVRAGYQYAAMADLAALAGRSDYAAALRSLWEDLVGRKLYITGGVGSAGSIEGFSAAYDLPNVSSYCETCASIAMVIWNHRMFLLSGRAEYVDVLERILYNGFLSGVSIDGRRFFYVNPLESQTGAERSEWFTCACCPSNVVRFLPQVPGYAYAVGGDKLYVNLFLAGSARVRMREAPVTIRQNHLYPWQGDIRIELEPEGGSREFTLKLRIPGWSRGDPVPGDLYHYLSDGGDSLALWVNGERVFPPLESGYAVIQRLWQAGDVVRLALPLQVRRTLAHPSVADDRGKAALERGPIVYCLEADENGGVWNLVLPDTASLQARYVVGVLGGVTVISGRAFPVRRTSGGGLSVGETREFRAIPYALWAHRGSRQMILWLARDAERAKPLPAPSIASGSTVTSSGGKNSEALADQLLPVSPDDRTIPFFHWYPRRGTQEWVEYTFSRPSRISRSSLFWVVEPHPRGCRPPSLWKLFARVDSIWQEITVSGKAGESSADFSPVEASAVRLELQMQAEHTAGLFEWVLE